MPSLRAVVEVLDALYDPRWADDWDAVGTVAGDPDAEVRKILFAVDPVQDVVDEAVKWGADLVVTHHPLFLKGVTSVSAGTPKGRVVHELLSRGIALHTCHTNADSPALGVSAAMAEALGLRDARPLVPDEENGVDSWVVHVPSTHAEAVLRAMHEAGAGAIGSYDRAAFRIDGDGQFRPLPGANPAIGSIGDIEHVAESRFELVAPTKVREQVREALVDAHPYEVVSYLVMSVAPRPTDRGTGRIGVLAQEMTLGEFAARVVEALPAHHSATRIAGDLDAPVRTVALCGGSGDFLLGAADAAGADVYLTSDLRHHPVSEHRERRGACAVVDVPHWAAEWTWLPVAAREVGARLGDTVETHVSSIVTDPWTHAVAPSPRSSR